MTPLEYRLGRKALRLTQAELAQRLQLNVHTIARRERGEMVITREAELALRLLLNNRSRLDSLAAKD